MLTLGITGHRFLSDEQAVASHLDEVFRRISQAYPGEEWTLVSPLAQGSDQLFVQAGWRFRASPLIVPLPMPKGEYMQSFTTDRAKHEFEKLLSRADQMISLPSCTSPEEAYASMGRFLVEKCSLLVAIWDGKPALGTGGTGQVVGWARSLGLPLAWIHALNASPDAKRVNQEFSLKGSITYERFPEVKNLR